MNTKQKVGILNYGAGNFGSVKRAVEALNIQPAEVVSAADLFDVDKLIFPGVGSARQAMDALLKRDLIEPLRDYVAARKPLLGICVGMQVLGEWSAEGDTRCLGFLPYSVEKFVCQEPIPHMGWNSIDWQMQHPLSAQFTPGLLGEVNFYFVHSYAAFVAEKQIPDAYLMGATVYGGRRFAAFVAQENLWGAQCHIEKSGRVGLRVLQNFLDWERR